MSSEPTVSDARLWEMLGGAIPADLGGKRVFDLAPAGATDRVSGELNGRGAEAVTHAELDAEWQKAGYHLVVCRDVIQRDAHPAQLLTRLWGIMAEGGTLLLHSPVMTAPERSQYARFVAAAAGTGATEWLPGRLALRWSVETSGFDVDRWLATEENPRDGVADAALVATRTTRLPSLMLATPAAAEGAAGARGDEGDDDGS